jgi:putative transposase
VVDGLTRECAAVIPDTSISGERVFCERDALIARRGPPKMILQRQRNGVHLERRFGLAASAKLNWLFVRGGKTHPVGFVERFNGLMRDALRNETLFFGTMPARLVRRGRRTSKSAVLIPHSVISHLAAYAATLSCVDLTKGLWSSLDGGQVSVMNQALPELSW